MPHLQIRVFLIQQELYSSFMHPVTKLKAMYVMMHTLCYSSCCQYVVLIWKFQFWQQTHQLQCCLRKTCNDRKGNRYCGRYNGSTLQLCISSKQKLWSSIVLFGILKALLAIVALLSLQKTLLCKMTLSIQLQVCNSISGRQ